MTAHPFPPLHVVSLSPARAFALVWHAAGEHRVTIVVKASFELVHDGVAQLVKADAPVMEDVRAPASGSLVSPSELAPFLPGADVILKGHACAPSGQTTRSMSVRLGVFRDRWLIDKTLHVYGDRASKSAPPAPFQRMPIVYERAAGGPGIEDNPAGVGAAPSDPRAPNILDPRDPTRAAGFGPIARGWSPRVRLAPREPARDGSVLVVPDGFPFRYFHAAPVDQQVEHLRGDEWLSIEGMHPTIPRFSVRLPSARGAAMRYRADGKRAAPLPIELVADTLSIDMDALVATMLFRGHFTLAPGETTASFRAFAGVELPGVPLDWPDLDDLVAPLSGPSDAGDAEEQADPLGESDVLEVLEIDAVETATETEPELEELQMTAPMKAVKTEIVDSPVSAAPSTLDLQDMTCGVSIEEIRARASRPIAPFALAEPGQSHKHSGAIPGAPWSPTAPPPSASGPPSVPLPEPAEIRTLLPALHIDAPETMDVSLDALRAHLPTPFVAPPPGAAAPSPPPVAAPPQVVSSSAGDTLPLGARSPLAPPTADDTLPAGARSPLAPPTADDTLPIGARSPLAPPLAAPVPPPLAAPVPPPLAAPVPPPLAAPPPKPEMIGPLATIEPPPKPEMLRPVEEVAAQQEVKPRVLPALPALPALAVPMLVKPAAQKEPGSKPKLAVPAMPAAPAAPAAAKTSSSAGGAGASQEGAKGAAQDGPSVFGAGAGNASNAGSGGAAPGTTTPAAGAGASNAPSGATVPSVAPKEAKVAAVGKVSARELVVARLSAREPLAGLELSGADLHELDLTGAELSGANLRGATLSGSKLFGARLCDADLSEADLSQADLSGADLSRADLSRSDLSSSRAEKAVFTEAKLSRATLTGTNFREARLSKASLDHVIGDGAIFVGARLDGAELRQARLFGALLDGADLKDASAARADLTQASLVAASLDGAQLRSCRLREANLERASLEGADLRDADLTKSDMRGAKRSGAKLSGATMRDVVE